jgi:hypothetical protein
LLAEGDLSGAKTVILDALQIKPDDKEFKNQLATVEQRLTQSGSTQQTSSAESHQRTQGSSVSSSSSKPPDLLKATTGANATAGTSSSGAGEEHDEEDEAGGDFRGYKKTKDGKITTFFNREIDENTKALIGDIAPQKVQGGAVGQGQGEGQGGVLGSVWNSAGTFEATDHSKQR